MSVKELVCFQNIPSDVQKLIASYSSTCTLLVLSGVNKSAYDYLHNEEFFKDHYYKEHPSLKPYDKLYTVLITTHPLNCWKVMCKVMDAQWGIDWQNPSIAKRVSVAFIEEARPEIVEKLTNEIEAGEAKDKEICGSGYDPSSPIDKAWKEAENCLQERKALATEYRDLSRKLHEAVELEAKEKNVQIDERQLLLMMERYFDADPERFISCPYEEFVERGTDEAISKDLYSLYQKMMEGSLQLSPFFEKSLILQVRDYSLSMNYEFLESERKRNENAIRDKKERLTELLADPAQFHLRQLSWEWSSALLLEHALKDKVSLGKCLELVEKLNAHPEEQFPESFEEVRRLINTCANYSRIQIWQGLYDRCANGQIEDSWAEKHFKDFLPELKAILSQKISHVKFQIWESERGSMSNPQSSEYCYSNDSTCSEAMPIGAASEVGESTASFAESSES